MTRCQHFLLSFLLLQCSEWTVSAQIYAGYCPDKISAKGLSNAKVDVTVSCATAFTRDDIFAPYQACDLGLVSVGLSATEGLSSLHVWVSEHLASEPLIDVDVPVSSLTVGWNDVTLPNVVALSAYDTLYCGYVYTQSVKSVAAISHGTRKDLPLSFYLAVNGKWNNVAAKNGPVSIRAGVVGHAGHVMALHDLTLSHRCQPFCTDYTQHQPLLLRGTVQNLGTQSLHDIRLTYADNDAEPVSATLALGHDIAFGETASFAYSLVPGQTVTAPQTDIALQLTVGCTGEAADATILDGQRTLYYDLYDDSQLDTPTINIIEEFTSERCGFAPVGQQRLREAVALAKQQADPNTADFVILSHHEGFGPADAWRVTDKSDYDASLFGPDKLTFAPAAMVNRATVPFSTTLPADSMAALLQTSPMQSFAALQIDDVTHSGNQVTATVSVQPCVLSFCENPQLVLCVVQPEVASKAQKNYYPQDYPGDVQRDVIRCYLHNVTGSDALLQKADMEAVMNGTVRTADYVEVTADGKIRFEYRGTLPSDLSSLSGLTLVAYIYDKGYTNQMYGGCVKRL